MAALAHREDRARAVGDLAADDQPRSRRRARGRGSVWQADGTLSARYWSEASKEHVDPAGIFYFWNGERPRHPDAPQLEGTGEIKLESVDRAAGYWTTRSDGPDAFHARTSGIYLRADPGDRPCSTAATPPSARHSSRCGSRSGSRSPTPDRSLVAMTPSVRRRRIIPGTYSSQRPRSTNPTRA